jgi:hypothetical protein
MWEGGRQPVPSWYGAAAVDLAWAPLALIIFVVELILFWGTELAVAMLILYFVNVRPAIRRWAARRPLPDV